MERFLKRKGKIEVRRGELRRKYRGSVEGEGGEKESE